jgi:hypothetical protein
MNLSLENDQLRLRAAYELDFGGIANLDVLVPNENLTVLEIHAIACEQAAESLSRRAAGFRQLIAKLPA